MRSLGNLLFGAPRDPMAPLTRRRMALIAVLAWVGIGADGLSSVNYGPEQAFLALGEHGGLGLGVALATGFTVFVIALGYNQVVELFPSGGGGYKAASRLLGAHAGLVAGSALAIDYVLTIAISVAAGVDALFSLLAPELVAIKIPLELAIVALLVALNLRGARESILVLAPIFIAFLASHALLIGYGIAVQAGSMGSLVTSSLADTRSLASELGATGVLALALRAYAIGAGTYTGIEALSNTVHTLAEPRVRTAKLAMAYTAASLAFTAVGIMLVYLLWNAVPTHGQTLNAVAFRAILADLFGDGALSQAVLSFALVSASALLFSAANTGFVGGPATLANMAADYWVPHAFGYLSTRLVTQNGVLLMGAAAIGTLLLTGGQVAILVVLYSVAVFAGFLLSFAGLVAHWLRQRSSPGAWRKLALALLSGSICGLILAVMLVERLRDGGLLALVLLATLVGTCMLLRQHYEGVKAKLDRAGELFVVRPGSPLPPLPPAKPDPTRPIAVFLMGPSLAAGMHTLLWVERLFPGHFKSYVFISVGEVDAQSFGGAKALEKLQRKVGKRIAFYMEYAHRHGVAAEAVIGFGTDLVAELTTLCDRVAASYPHAVFFGTKLVFERDNWIVRLLHNQTAIALQRRLHLAGRQMMILPMRV
ncbi:MAG: APC family permease [Alphaproteobacteria bacterium]|nr:APC family permease [Alphaproteobacteria bacterium]